MYLLDSDNKLCIIAKQIICYTYIEVLPVYRVVVPLTSGQLFLPQIVYTAPERFQFEIRIYHFVCSNKVKLRFLYSE